MHFSIIIPTRNSSSLSVCLNKLVSLNYPPDAWEVIVVNDGGDNPTTTIIPEIEQQLCLRYIEIEHRGAAAARNAGVRQATGNYLAFIDDDCFVDPDWLWQLALGFESKDWDALGGQVLNAFPDKPAAVASQHLVNFLYEYMQDVEGNALLLFSGNAAYKHSVFDSLGGFDETFPRAGAEDFELSYRLLAKGYRQRYWQSAKVWHCHRKTVKGFLAQQFQFGRGAYFLKQSLKQNKLNLSNKLRSPQSFYPALAEFLWRAHVPFNLWWIVGASQIAYRVGRIYQTIQANLCFRTESLLS